MSAKRFKCFVRICTWDSNGYFFIHLSVLAVSSIYIGLCNSFSLSPFIVLCFWSVHWIPICHKTFYYGIVNSYFFTFIKLFIAKHQVQLFDRCSGLSWSGVDLIFYLWDVNIWSVFLVFSTIWSYANISAYMCHFGAVIHSLSFVFSWSM